MISEDFKMLVQGAIDYTRQHYQESHEHGRLIGRARGRLAGKA